MLIHKVTLLIPSLPVSHIFPTLFFTFLISDVQKTQSYFCVCVLEKKNRVDGFDNDHDMSQNTYFSKNKKLFLSTLTSSMFYMNRLLTEFLFYLCWMGAILFLKKHPTFSFFAFFCSSLFPTLRVFIAWIWREKELQPQVTN